MPVTTRPAPPPPPPSHAETNDPRESITWPKGWIDAWDMPRRVKAERGRYGFEMLVGGLWSPCHAMGPVPHRRTNVDK